MSECFPNEKQVLEELFDDSISPILKMVHLADAMDESLVDVMHGATVDPLVFTVYRLAQHIHTLTEGPIEQFVLLNHIHDASDYVSALADLRTLLDLDTLSQLQGYDILPDVVSSPEYVMYHAIYTVHYLEGTLYAQTK